MSVAAAFFVCVAFLALARAFRVIERPVEVVAASRRASELLTDPSLDDDAKEHGMRVHGRALGRLFIMITDGALAATALPLAVVWLLDATAVVSFNAVLDALVSWPMLIVGVALALGRAGYEQGWRRGSR